MRDKIQQIAGSVTIKLPGETVIVGPGTVPSSSASPARTSIEEMSAALKKASKLGLFDSYHETAAAGR